MRDHVIIIALFLLAHSTPALADSTLPRRNGRLVAGNVVVEEVGVLAPIRPQTNVCLGVTTYADRLAVNKNDALVALAHGRQIALGNQWFAKQLFEHFQQRRQVAVVDAQVEDAGAAVAEQRLDDDVPVLGPEFQDLVTVAADQGRRHQGDQSRKHLFHTVRFYRRSSV